MNLLCWALLTLAWGQSPPEEIQRQRQVVEAAAAEVAAARARDARRSELADLMGRFREERVRLQELEQQAAPDQDAIRTERLEALEALADAVARGKDDADARGVVAEWLGEVEPRLALLTSALAAAADVTSEALRRSMLVDVGEQSHALALAASYDAMLARADADRARLRAATLRRMTTPGQGADLEDLVEAERWDAMAADAQARAERAGVLRQRAIDIQEQVMTPSEGDP